MDFSDFWEGNKVKIIIFLFFVLAVIYFGSFLTPRKMIHGSDWLISGYPNMKTNFDYIKQHHRIPMWDLYNFSGYPAMVVKGAGSILYPLNFIYFILPYHLAYTVLFIIHIFLAGLGMWLLLREYKLSHLASMLGAVTFMFAGQLITTTQGGHIGRSIAVIVLPFSFFFIHRALERKEPLYFIPFGGVTGFMLLAGQVQIDYWAMIGVFFYFLYEIIRRRKDFQSKGVLKFLGLCALGAILAALIISVKLLPPAFSLGYGARGATRGYAYSTSWSLPTSELFNLIAPHFSGILENYWGENYFKLDSRYLGVLPLLFFGLAFLSRKKRYIIRYFMLFTGVTLLLALGKNIPLFRLCDSVLMIKKFRAPSMFFFLTTFGIAVLSGFGAQVVMDIAGKKDDETEKKTFIFIVSTVGVILLMAIIVSLGDVSILQSMKSHFVNAWMGIMGRGSLQQKIFLMQQNFGNFKKSLWISSLLFIINGGLVIAVIKRKLDFGFAVPIFVLVLLWDQWAIDLKYLSSVPAPKKYYAADDVTNYIKRDSDLFRVCPINYKNGESGYFQYHEIQNVSGMSPNPPKRYQEFIGAVGSVIFTPRNLMKYPHLLSMLNVKYIVGPRLPEDLTRYDERVKTAVEEFRRFYSNFSVMFVGNSYQVLKNEGFLPGASLVYDYTTVGSAEEALNRILSSEFKPGNIVLLEEKPGVTLSEGSGEVNINKIIANEKILNVETDKPAFLIIRENYHSDWKCYVDGKKEKIYRSNYLFYGIFIPEGEHEVRFVYESRIFNLSLLLYVIGSIIFVCFCLWLGIKKLIKKILRNKNCK